MTDYSKWKVTDLKAELKRRGVAQTGLRVKQQFIDKLLEEDAKGPDGDQIEDAATAQDSPHEESQAAAPEQSANADDTSTEQKEEEPTHPVDENPTAKPESTIPEVAPANIPSPEDAPQQQLLRDSSNDQPAEPAPVEEPSQEAQEPEKIEVQIDTTDKQPETKPAVEPVEQAPGDAAAAAAEPSARRTSSEAAPAEPTKNARKPGTNISETSAEASTPLPTDEILEDRRKRKRRSQTPVPTPEDMSRKKAKAGATEAEVPENKDLMEVDAATQQEAPVSIPQETLQQTSETPGVTEDAHEQDATETKKGAPPKQDVRFKGLFAPTEKAPARPASPPADTAPEDIEVEPALHAATAALYIEGLMRPLQPAALRTHLIAIAASPGASPNPDSIVDFYLDPIKTHCFVTFVNVSTASRVRTSLHGTVWPDERNRKSLFVDFIPEHKMQEWIRIEDNSRQRGGPPPRWEVKYDKTDDGVKAVLEEADPKNAATHTNAPRGPAPTDFVRPPPRGPKADLLNKDRRPSGPPPAQAQAQASSAPGQGFKPLDELFSSTTTKPKLYYLPVPRSVADKRLDRFDDLLQKGSYPRRGGDETRRITFEDGDLFVDIGPEFPGRARGGRGRGRGRGGGGMGGDQWRGARRE